MKNICISILIFVLAVFPAAAAPLVTGVSPSTGSNLGPVTAVVTGSGFFGGGSSADVSAVILHDGGIKEITVTGYNTVSDTEIQNVIIPSAGRAGTYNVKVTTSEGTNSTSSQKYIVTTASPSVSGISLTAGANSGATTISISGTGFFGGLQSQDVLSVKLENGGPYLTGYSAISDSEITGAIVPALGTAGTYDVSVTTDGGANITSAVKFVITDSNPPVEIYNGNLLSAGSKIRLLRCGDGTYVLFFHDNSNVVAKKSTDSGATWTKFDGTSGTETI